jgi:hypothetical protein
VIDLPDDFPVNCFLCPLDPAGAADEIRARFSAAGLDAVLKILKPAPPPPPPTPPGEFSLRPVEGLKRVKIRREGKPDVELYLSDRESNTDRLGFLGDRIASLLRERQQVAESQRRAAGEKQP